MNKFIERRVDKLCRLVIWYIYILNAGVASHIIRIYDSIWFYNESRI